MRELQVLSNFLLNRQFDAGSCEPRRKLGADHSPLLFKLQVAIRCLGYEMSGDQANRLIEASKNCQVCAAGEMCSNWVTNLFERASSFFFGDVIGRHWSCHFVHTRQYRQNAA